MKAIAGALIAVFCIAVAAPAGAITISGTLYEDTIEVDCSSSTECVASFPLPSAITGKFLNLEDVSCFGIVGQPFRQGALFLSDGNFQNVRRQRGLTLAGPNSGQNFSWHEAVQFKISGGPPRVVHISMVMAAATTMSAICTIVGTTSTE